MRLLAGIGWPLVAVGLWLEVCVLVIQVATDSCSFGYCPVAHHTLGAVPYVPAAFVATLAVLVLAGMLVLDSRLGRREPAAKPPSARMNLSSTTGLILVLGILVWFGALSLLTWGQPFGWIAAPPPCVAPDMNLYCDTETSAELFHAYGPIAFVIASGAGALVVGALLGVRHIVSRMSPPL